MKLSTRDSVVATVAYADIFDYPLTPEELDKWLIASTDFRITHLPENVSIQTVGGKSYICFSDRASLISIRKKRYDYATGKWQKARRFARYLSIMPTVRLIGVTGALAMNNTYDDDDIDLLFVVQGGTLWVSRFILIFITEILGVRRRPGDMHFKDKLCLNMFLGDISLAVTEKEHDLYMAHEVLQMIPLWSSGKTYDRFLTTNSWVQHFLPNAWDKAFMNRYAHKRDNSVLRYLWQYIGYILCIFEPIMKIGQLAYMKKRRTNEIITDTILRFHPKDAKVWVKRELGIRIGRFSIPLDKLFYDR